MSEPHRVLIVEDVPMTRLMASEALSASGFAVFEADSAEAAMAMLPTVRPDLILLDLVMPGMGGLALCAWLRTQAQHSRLPVLVMTALEGDEPIRQAFDAGASDFIAKPLNTSILMHRVRFLLRARDTLRALEASRRNLQEAQGIARIGSWELNRVTGEAICSDVLFEILDRDRAFTPSTLASYLSGVHPDDRERVQCEIAAAVEQHAPLDTIHRFVMRDGQLRWIQLRVKFEYDANGHALRSYGTVQDITQQRRIEARLDYLARHDPVTGLPNQHRFVELLHQRIAHRHAGSLIAVMHIDLERYQRINKGLGHEAGDALLVQVSQGLARVVTDTGAPCGETDGSQCVLARWSGAEFIALLGELSSPHEASRVAQRLLERIRCPVRSNDSELILDARIGIALHPDDGATASRLINASIAATQHAKRRGHGAVQFYSPEIDADALLRLQLETDLRSALADEAGGGLVLNYQPKHDHTGRIECAEALVRWQHPTLGLLEPDRFVALAEESDLIVALGAWVIGSACKQLRSWHDAGLPPARIAINLSAAHFVDDDLLPLLVAHTRRWGVSPQQLELELTESMVMQDTKHVRERLHALHERGFHLTIDDFGMGYSSLSKLSFLPLDTLKIDRSFIRDMLTVPRQAAIVRGIIALAKSLGLSVVAEGVESAAQAAALSQAGCDLMQGYHFSCPLSADELAAQLAR